MRRVLPTSATNQQIKTNVFLGRRAHTHFQISKQQFSASGPCERREKQLYSTLESNSGGFFPSTTPPARERQQGNNTKPRAQAACSQNALFALRVVIQEYLLQRWNRLWPNYSYFDRPRNKTIIKSKLKNSRCRHLAQHTAANLLGALVEFTRQFALSQRIIPREWVYSNSARPSVTNGMGCVCFRVLQIN